MGRRIVSRGGNSRFFQRYPKGFFQGEGKIDEISFYSLETKKQHYLLKS